MPRPAQRRFTKLDTKEVSLVDVPANEKEFAVIKTDSTEDEDMTVAASQTTTDDATRVPVEVDDGGNDVVDALKHVDAIVGRIESIVAKGKASDDAADDDATDDDTTTDDTTKSDDSDDVDVDKDMSIQDVLTKAGLKGDPLKAALASLEKAGKKAKDKFPFNKDDDDKKEAKTKKAAGDDTADDDTADDDEPPMTMDGLAVAIQKAAAFTPNRVKKLQEAADILKLVLEAIAPNATPKTRVPGVSQHSLGNATEVLTKSERETLKALKSLADVVKGLGERVEATEKARNPSNSVDEDGETDTDTKTEKSIWSGLL